MSDTTSQQAQADAISAALVERYGCPDYHVPETADALRKLGLRGKIHPNDAVAYSCPTREAADAFMATNAEHYGIPSLGSYDAGESVVCVGDLRPWTGDRALLSDPAAPDDQLPPVSEWYATQNSHPVNPDGC